MINNVIYNCCFEFFSKNCSFRKSSLRNPTFCWVSLFVLTFWHMFDRIDDRGIHNP